MAAAWTARTMGSYCSVETLHRACLNADCLSGTSGQALPGLDNRVGVERHRQNTLVTQPLGQIGVVAGPLTADTHVLACGQASLDGAVEHELDGFVAL